MKTSFFLRFSAAMAATLCFDIQANASAVIKYTGTIIAKPFIRYFLQQDETAYQTDTNTKKIVSVPEPLQVQKQVPDSTYKRHTISIRINRIGSTVVDHTEVKFNAVSGKWSDKSLDQQKDSSPVKIWTEYKHKMFEVKNLGRPNNELSFEIGYKANLAGYYTLELNNIEMLIDACSPYLEKGKVLILQQGKSESMMTLTNSMIYGFEVNQNNTVGKVVVKLVDKKEVEAAENILAVSNNSSRLLQQVQSQAVNAGEKSAETK